MNEPPEPSKSAKGRWWMVWLLATVILPSIAGVLFAKNTQWACISALVLGCISVGLHLGASVRLNVQMGSLYLFLVLGGWVLMLVSFFYGCAAGYSPLI